MRKVRYIGGIARHTVMLLNWCNFGPKFLIARRRLVF
jgi:hypothetical protein